MKLIESDHCRAHAKVIFEKWKPIIETSIPASKVEHIGSTAVRGVLTKGDIDLYVEVAGDAHAAAVSTIETMGFTVKPNTHRDAELCMLERSDVDNFALQVVAQGSKYRFFLEFRDALNSSNDLVEKYNALKLSCSGNTPEQYRKHKSQFIMKVLNQL